MAEIRAQYPAEESQRLIEAFPGLRMLSWNELGELARAGVEIGSHGVHHDLHHSWQPREERMRELSESRRTLESRLGRPCRSFAFPNGDYLRRVGGRDGERRVHGGIHDRRADRRSDRLPPPPAAPGGPALAAALRPRALVQGHSSARSSRRRTGGQPIVAMGGITGILDAGRESGTPRRSRRRMKPVPILYTIPNFDTAGSGQALLNVVARLDRRRFAPSVCVLRRGGQLEGEIERLGIPLLESPFTVEARPLVTLPSRARQAAAAFRGRGFALWHSYHYLDDYTEPLVARFAGVRAWIYTKKSMSWNRRPGTFDPSSRPASRR